MPDNIVDNKYPLNLSQTEARWLERDLESRFGSNPEALLIKGLQENDRSKVYPALILKKLKDCINS